MGRQLESYAKAGTNVQYTYNESGLRTRKVVNGTATTYHLVGDQVTMEQTGTQTPIRYAYDAAGQLFLIQYDGQNYFYARNAQGDIIGMVDANGNWVVEYKYDAWGKLLSTTGTLANTLGIANPYRYRGYRYDTETGFYATGTRYYDPVVGRFINTDTTDILLASPDSPNWDKNLFAYCDNNPVNRIDEAGEIWNWIVGGVVGAVAGAAVSIVSQAVSGNGINWRSVGASAAAGAVTGLLMATPGAQGIALTLGQTMLCGAAASGAGYATYNAVNGTRSTWKGLAYSMAFGALSAGFGYKLSNLSACFVAGTTVLTSEGHVPIEKVQLDDMIWAENPETGEKALKRVVQTFIRETDQFVHIKVYGQDITTTPEHPFYVPQKGWTDAIGLRAGDILVMQNGKYVIVEQVQHEILETPATVYNFEVEDFHTYYVTDSSILVHNTCGFANFRTLNNTIIKGYKVSMDLERGGSGLINIHLKVGSTKYFWNGTDFVNSAGKGIPNSLKGNATIANALNEALKK